MTAYLVGTYRVSEVGLRGRRATELPAGNGTGFQCWEES